MKLLPRAGWPWASERVAGQAQPNAIKGCLTQQQDPPDNSMRNVRLYVVHTGILPVEAPQLAGKIRKFGNRYYGIRLVTSNVMRLASRKK